MMHNRLTVISASTAWNTVARFDDSVRGLLAIRYDLIARGGGAERARMMLGQAGLLPEPAA